MTPFDFFPQELSAQYFAKEQELMSRGEPLIDFEEPIVKADGKPGWVLTNKIPICNLDGEVIGLVGIGLGLAISKQLLEAVGGRIDVTSVKNQGSTFTIEFPRGQRTT